IGKCTLIYFTYYSPKAYHLQGAFSTTAFVLYYLRAYSCTYHYSLILGGIDGTRRPATWSISSSAAPGKRRDGRSLPCRRYTHRSPANSYQGDLDRNQSIL